MTTPCYIYSKANYPVVIKYDGQSLVIPPNAKKFKLPNTNLVGSLPAKLRKVDIEGDQ
jgi:hypothetical protein